MRGIPGVIHSEERRNAGNPWYKALLRGEKECRESLVRCTSERREGMRGIPGTMHF
jgi:hypothetical protein